ncbi:MAG: hypothetical protein NBV77_04015 [Bacteroidia bacterium]|nr:hypothetical protein [Bacteroidia bacterium]
MRPITKKQPVNKAGKKIQFDHWGEAKPYLIRQTCRYCHFCEMPILNVPAVEHIKPKECYGNKNKYENLRNEWSNLLLICHYCNSTKGNLDIKLHNYYWPHKQNTLIVFEHLSGVLVPSSKLTANQPVKANATIALYGLDKKVNSSGGVDTRFEYRLKAISQALERYAEYTSVPRQATLNGIIGQAGDSGFWSVWYNVFNAMPEVRAALVKQFKASKECFNVNNNPIHRNQDDPVDTI